MAATESTRIFAENIRAEMALRGWNQTQLAEKSGMSQPRISEILREEKDIRLGTVDRVARAFGLSALQMLTPRPPEKKFGQPA